MVVHGPLPRTELGNTVLVQGLVTVIVFLICIPFVLYSVKNKTEKDDIQ